MNRILTPGYARRLFLRVLLVLSFAANAFAQKNTIQNNSGTNTSQYSLLSINNFTSWLRADGTFSHTLKDSMGTIFPRGKVPIVFRGTFIWGALAYRDSAQTRPAPFDQLLRVGGGVFVARTQPGRIIGFGADAVAADKLAPETRVYRIRRDFFEMDEAELRREALAYFELGNDPGVVTPEQIAAIREMYARDWMEWPVQHGAPFIDRNSNGVFDPPPAFSAHFTLADLVAGGHDEPGITAADIEVPADQVIWTVFNDLDEAETRSFAGSRPLGLELQVTQWTYRSDADWGAVFYRKVKLINKGGVEIDESGNKGMFWLDDMHFAQWVDPDLGFLSDDLAGCDTTLSLGYIYNSTSLDTVFRVHNLPPAAAGYMILQGPVVRNPNQSAIVDFKTVSGWQNLPMTAFNCRSVGDARATPSASDPNAARSWYKVLRGFDPISETDQFYPAPPGIAPGPLPLSGDPVTGTGFLDGQSVGNWPLFAGDKRITVSAGPFAMAPGDTQEVVLAFVAGIGNDHLTSVHVLKHLARLVRTSYPNHYAIPNETTQQDDDKPPSDYLLAQNYPNPFNASTRIDFALPQDAEVRLAIFDVLGREIAVLLERSLAAGTHSAVWDGRDASGKDAPSGHYIYKLQARHIELSRGLTLIR